MIEPKKLAPIRILQMLEEHSDVDHPLTQEQIAAYLDKNYGIVLERKAIGRNIALLKDAGYDIMSGRGGCYLCERRFSDAELHLLIDGVLCSKHITAKHSSDLIDRLCALSSKYFRASVKNVYSVNEWSKTDNQALFYNIELIDEAIEKNRRISFDFNRFGLDKKLHKTAAHTVSPYQMLLHNQRYYLMARNERWGDMTFYRLDHITNMHILEDEARTPLTQTKGYENGISYAELATTLPYMYNDKPEQITFLAEEFLTDQIIDWFGTSATMQKEGDRIRVSVKASLNAMEYWAMQYLNYVEVTAPSSLRERIKQNLGNAAGKYK